MWTEQQFGAKQQAHHGGQSAPLSLSLAKSQPEKSEAASDNEGDPARPHRYRPVPDDDGHSIKIRTRWNSATTAKITPATRENVFASMSHHPEFLTQGSTQGGGARD